MTTRDMEKAILGHRWGMGRYHFWEVKMPDTKERVDMIEYITPKGFEVEDIEHLEVWDRWNFYELKLSLADLKNGRPCTWRGAKNYLVCPDSLWEAEEVRALVPDHVGVYAVYHTEIHDVHGFGKRYECECVKKAKAIHSDCPGMMWACFKAGSRAFDSLKLG